VVVLAVFGLMLQMSPVHAQSTAVKIMPLGDSITMGADNNGYRKPLYFLLADWGYVTDFVGILSDGDFPDREHEGHWGWTADMVLAGIYAWTLADQPDIVLMHLGTNDIDFGDSVASTITELGQIIDKIRSINPGVIILLAQIIPSTGISYSERIFELNSEIPGLAQEKTSAQSPIIVVDQWTGFYPATDLGDDGEHPNASGNQKMAQKWFDVLTTVLEAGHDVDPLVAYWPLDDWVGGTARDVTENGNDGTLVHGPVWTTGQINGALQFDGLDDYVEVAHSPTLNVTGNALTITAWVKAETTGTHQIILSKPYLTTSHQSPYFAYSIHLLYAGSSGYSPRFWITRSGGGYSYIQSSQNIPTGQWVHIAGVYDGSLMRIYVDGVLRGSAAASGNLIGYATPLRLGTNGGLSEFFKGQMDGVRIYDIALTGQEVLDLYNDGLSGGS